MTLRFDGDEITDAVKLGLIILKGNVDGQGVPEDVLVNVLTSKPAKWQRDIHDTLAFIEKLVKRGALVRMRQGLRVNGEFGLLIREFERGRAKRKKEGKT